MIFIAYNTQTVRCIIDTLDYAHVCVVSMVAWRSRWALIEISPNIILLPQIGILYDKFHIFFSYLRNFHCGVVCIGHDRVY